MVGYNSFISFELAKFLKEENFNFIEFDGGEFVEKDRWFYNESGDTLTRAWEVGAYDSDYCFNCFVYRAVTYGEILDYFANKGYIITLHPFHTFALKNNTGYTWQINYMLEGVYHVIKEEDDYTGGGFGGSFEATIVEAIKKMFKL